MASDTELAPGIVTNPGRMRGQPIIAGTRITVENVLDKLANGYTVEDILAAYPHLTRGQVLACLAYATELVRAQAPAPRFDVQELMGEVARED